MAKNLDTESYKGTRDFYPEDMAVQRYIFDTWARTAELFGFERYDASILEPSELYKSKGAENEELVNEQTYTFTDRGDREVTLRPEMTPTVARMIVGRRRDLSFPVRWYSIPNLFRYERPQRGRLREHWQLNCDIFGVSDYSADVELISLAYHTLLAFGATPDMFEIRINNREEMRELFNEKVTNDAEKQNKITKLTDRYHKISNDEYRSELNLIVGEEATQEVISIIESHETGKKSSLLLTALHDLGIHNVRIDRTLARGFDYYTGTIFEIFDTSEENNRALMGGGRYDNLTELFGGEAITGVGFGMGDVTMHDFLKTHGLLEGKVLTTAPTLVVLPLEQEFNIEGEKIAHTFRSARVRTSVDLSDKKIGKKIGNASDAGSRYILVVGADEVASQTFTLKELSTQNETIGPLSNLLNLI